MKGHRRGARGRGARSRWQTTPGEWIVRARVERFVEPALLLLLSERPRHGYELLEELPALAGAEGRLDLGNLYRVLRALEAEGVVTSEWHADLPGPAKRTYTLTTAGRALLDRWAEALRGTRQALDGFLDRYERQKGGEG